jgi:NAD(P)H-nitrite reductase large subunit
MSCCKNKQLPTSDYPVCGCMNVWHENIVQAISAGADTFEKLQEQLKVSTGCGTCADKVKEILKNQLSQNCK